ncbi:MAG TPA: vWA domain-containing protein [Methylomirabilota bacterium]|nr:vWA domain-containing protein [Methylomirabilota bacterium]
MSPLPEMSHLRVTPSPVLIGVLVDVSNSMRRNWGKKGGKKLPRIEVIKEALNKRIKEEQRLQQSQEAMFDNVEIFCLGMGFKSRVHTRGVDLSDEQEHSLGAEAKEGTHVDLICDLLALGEILPSKEKLSEFQEKLNQRWVQYSHEILEKSVITENVYIHLVEYVQASLYQSAMERLHQSLSYQLHHRFSRLFLFLSGKIKAREEKIITLSQIAAAAYAEDVFKKTTSDFNDNQNKYCAIVQKNLNDYVQYYICSTLRALTLGFEVTELVNDLDIVRITTLAKQIYAQLDKEVRNHIKFALSYHQQKLFVQGRRIAAHFDKKELRRLTERFIQKTVWDILKPLIENTVYTMFSEQFKIQSQNSFPYWIRLASTREIVRPLSQLSTILPEVIEEHVYSEEVMFGTTPFSAALDRAAIRFIDKSRKDRSKVFVIISDGEFENVPSVRVSIDLLKRRGVILVSCLVANRNIFSGLAKRSRESWPTGARLMVEIASEASDLEDMKSRWQGEQPFPTLIDKKLCFQVNHSYLLDDVIAYIFDSYRNRETT